MTSGPCQANCSDGTENTTVPKMTRSAAAKIAFSLNFHLFDRFFISLSSRAGVRSPSVYLAPSFFSTLYLFRRSQGEKFIPRQKDFRFPLDGRTRKNIHERLIFVRLPVEPG
jgi:hypothetical protein